MPSTLFQTIEIDGEAYWDGGYMGNPAIFPPIYGCQSTDVIVIHINPIVRETVPPAASDILNRLNEISFNSSLMREMRAIAFANKLVDRGGAARSRACSARRVASELLGYAHGIVAQDFVATDLISTGGSPDMSP